MSRIDSDRSFRVVQVEPSMREASWLDDLCALNLEMYRETWHDHLVDSASFRNPALPGWLVLTGGGTVAAVADIAPRRACGEERRLVSAYVRGSFRRLGIGGELVRLVLSHGRGHGMTSFELHTRSHMPPSDKWIRVLDAHGAMNGYAMELQVGAATKPALQAWLGSSVPPGVVVDVFRGAYNSGWIQQIAALKVTIDKAWGRKSETDEIAHSLASSEEHRGGRARTERWKAVAYTNRDEVVGFSEALWSPNAPQLLWHTEIAVSGSMRKAGVSRLLRTRLLTTVLEQRPSIRSVRGTLLADAPGMVRGNRRLGYRIHHRFQIWHL